MYFLSNIPTTSPWKGEGSCLKTGQHIFFVIIYLLLPIYCIILVFVSKILFNFLLPIIIIMILIMKILLHYEYKILNLWYLTYVYQFFNFPYNYKNRVLASFQTRPKARYTHWFHFGGEVWWRRYERYRASGFDGDGCRLLSAYIQTAVQLGKFKAHNTVI